MAGHRDGSVVLTYVESVQVLSRRRRDALIIERVEVTVLRAGKRSRGAGVALVRIGLRSGHRHFEGWGEAPLKRSSGPVDPSGWALPRGLLDALHGQEIAIRGAGLLDEVVRVIGTVREVEADVPARASVLVALELALLDAVAPPDAVGLPSSVLANTASGPGAIRSVPLPEVIASPQRAADQDVLHVHGVEDLPALKKLLAQLGPGTVGLLWIWLSPGWSTADVRRLLRACHTTGVDGSMEVVLHDPDRSSRPAAVAALHGWLLERVADAAITVALEVPGNPRAAVRSVLRSRARVALLAPQRTGVVVARRVAAKLRKRAQGAQLALLPAPWGAVLGETVPSWLPLVPHDHPLPVISSRALAVSESSLDVVARRSRLHARAHRVVAHASAPADADPRLDGRASNRYQIPRVAYRRGRDFDSYLLEAASMARGLDILRVNPFTFTAVRPGFASSLGFYWTATAGTTVAAREVTNDKELTAELLRRHGLPVARGATFTADAVEEAVTFAASIAGPVVVKPRFGRGGKGVATQLVGSETVRGAIAALERTPFAGQDFVVEEHIEGADYRVLVVAGEAASVLLRRPASVVGDGRACIGDLVVRKNALRRANPHLMWRPILLRADVHAHLAREGRSLESVPAAGEEVMLRGTANISQGGDSVEVLDEVHPSLLEIARAAAGMIDGLDYVGIDLLLADHTLALADQRGIISELNATPGIGGHRYPLFGSSRDVFDRVVTSSAVPRGIDVPPESEHVDVVVTLRGVLDVDGCASWMNGLGRLLGVEVRAHAKSPVAMRWRVAGPVTAVASLSSHSIDGPEDALVRTVEVEHVAVRGRAGRPRAPKVWAGG